MLNDSSNFSSVDSTIPVPKMKYLIYPTIPSFNIYIVAATSSNAMTDKGNFGCFFYRFNYKLMSHGLLIFLSDYYFVPLQLFGI